MQRAPRQTPVAVLFDSSLENGIDPILALAMVLACDSRREARLGGLSVSRNSLETAAFCELMVRFYRGERPGSAPGRASIPIGMFAEEAAVGPVPPMIATVVNRAGLDGQPLYPRTIEKLNDTADPVAVLRNALSAQQDQNAVIVLAGPPINLLRLMALPDGSDLIRRKVRALVVRPEGEDSVGVAQLLGEWPGPVILSDDAPGLRYPAAAIEQDFAWAPDHPVVDAWRSVGTGPDGAPATAAAAVLYAVHPDDDYFGLSDPAPGSRLRYRRLTTDREQQGRAIQTIRELVSAQPPEPRRGRGFP